MPVAFGIPQRAPQGFLGDGPHAMALNKYREPTTPLKLIEHTIMLPEEWVSLLQIL